MPPQTAQGAAFTTGMLLLVINKEGNDMKKPKNRHLDVPAEANRDKHINFTARERGEKDPSTDNPHNLSRKANKKQKKAATGKDSSR